MADKKPPLPSQLPPPSSGATNEHEFSVDMERFPADLSWSFSTDVATDVTSRNEARSLDTSFEMITMGSPVMSKWRWIGEKELDNLVKNRRGHIENSASTTELAGYGEQQPSPAVVEVGVLEKGAFVRVVTEGGPEAGPSVQGERGDEGARQKAIAHILLPTTLPIVQGGNVTKEDAASRKTTELVSVSEGKHITVASVIDTSTEQDLEKGVPNTSTVGIPAADRGAGEEPFCRVCHMSSAEPVKSEIIDLGCNCRFDLGHAHRECAETWFRVRGNRQCEICGEPAQNVRLLEPIGGIPAERGDATFTVVTLHRSPAACWQNRRIRNILLVFLVTAFLVPWLFRFAYYQFSPK